jgi:competence protein ComEC
MKRALLAALLFPLAAFADAHDKRLDIYWVDTEGGAATLIVTPAGESLLIDAGNPGDRDPPRVFKVAKEVAKLDRIDHLVTTHYHKDHFGGAAPVSTMIPIGTVWNNGDVHAGHDAPSQEYLDFKCDARKVLNPGEEIPLKQTDGAPALHAKCLMARQQPIAALAGATPNPLCNDDAIKHQSRDLSDNANSIVQVLEFGGFRFYDGGDLTWNMELKLACPVNLAGTIDVYQVTHHGLDLSNNNLLVASMQPTVAVISNGPKKGCNPHTVETLRSTKSIQAIYQTHRNLQPGQEAYNVTDPAYIANEDEQHVGNYVMISVDPQAKTYLVRVPSTKHERTFEVKGK